MTVVPETRLLNSDEIKRIELDILLYLQRICAKYDLKLYLCGGTLLGAVRHHGFIPWDDDIDVCLPRPDYEKLIDVLHREVVMPPYYRMLCFEDGSFTHPTMKIIDTRTVIDYDFFEDRQDTGLWIDILPVDGLPDSDIEISNLYKKTAIYRELLCLSLAKPGTGKTKLKSVLKWVAIPIAKFFGTAVYAKKLRDIAVEHEYSNSKNVGIITWGLYGAKEAMKKEEFEIPISVEFENHEFQAASCSKQYLENLYGDYMQLPPIEKRRTHDMKVRFCEQEGN